MSVIKTGSLILRLGMVVGPTSHRVHVPMESTGCLGNEKERVPFCYPFIGSREMQMAGWARSWMSGCGWL